MAKSKDGRNLGPAIVRHCANCIPHEFQDKKNGDKMRVMNPCPGTVGGVVYCCTVCGKKG